MNCFTISTDIMQRVNGIRVYICSITYVRRRVVTGVIFVECAKQGNCGDGFAKPEHGIAA